MACVESSAVRVRRSASLRLAARVLDAREAEAVAASDVTRARVLADDSALVWARSVA